MTSIIDRSSQQQQQQQQQMVQPPFPHAQQYRPTSASKSTRFALQPTIQTAVVHDRRSMSSDAPRKPVNTVISNQILSDTIIQSSSKPVRQFNFLSISVHLHIFLAPTKSSTTISTDLNCSTQ